MSQTMEVKPFNVAGLVAMLATLAGLIGFAIGAGAWQGKISQILVEHERRLNLQDVRDDRQDQHMASTDRDVSEMKSTLGTISYQVGFLVRRLQNTDHPFGGNRRPSESEDRPNG